MNEQSEMFGLKSHDLTKIWSVFMLHPELDKAIIYGSRAKGNYKPYSDIDLTLVGKDLNLSLQNKIENELDDLLLPYKFDISIYNTIANSDLVDHINRVGKEFYNGSSASH
jgi:type I restriction enzyme S subunit